VLKWLDIIIKLNMDDSQLQVSKYVINAFPDLLRTVITKKDNYEISNYYSNISYLLTDDWKNAEQIYTIWQDSTYGESKILRIKRHHPP